jgi:urease accessory protein
MIDVARSEFAESPAWLVPLLRFTSPSLPIGAYAYSRGLEYAVEVGWVHDRDSAAAWVLGLLQHTATRLEAPIFLRLWAAFMREDGEAAEHWNARLLASRESAELRLEDTQLGAALARLLLAQGVTQAQPWAARSDTCYATLFALCTAALGVPELAALSAYLWALCESQVSAALRLVPLGQTAAQTILGQITAALPACLREAAQLSDEQLGASAAGLAIASALHETQYTRLFRS